MLKKYWPTIMIAVIFETVAVVLWLTKDNMLFYPGLIRNENMQIEGFWYYLFTGVFEVATIHCAVAKYSVRCCSEEDGADMPAGRRWCLTFFPTRCLNSREGK